MIRIIEISAFEAEYIPTGIVDVDRTDDRKPSEAWSHVLHFFRDIDGNAHLILHGTANGAVAINGDIYYGNAAYEVCVNQGLIARGDLLDVICCHGRIVRDNISNSPESIKECHMTFLNTTLEANAIIVKYKKRYALVVYSSRNPKLTGIIAYLRAVYQLRG